MPVQGVDIVLRLGYDIGGMSIRACLLEDTRMEILTRRTRPFPMGQGEEALIAEMTAMADEIFAAHGMDRQHVQSVGVGIPGTVHQGSGVLLSACNLHLNGMPIAQHMRNYFPNARISLGNDADAAALAEYFAGAFRGYASALLITIGTGIGGGVIMNDRLFQGGLGLGCELGHITLQQDGPMCACGNRGCAEALCSATWLERQARHCILDYPMSRIATLAGGRMENVHAKDVIAAAQEGDGIANQIFNQYIDHLASLISSCAYLMSPRIVGVGGGISNARDFLIRPLEERVRARTRRYVPEKVVAAQLGDAAGMIGAAMLPVMAERGTMQSYYA